MDGNSVLIDLGSGGDVIEHASEHAFRIFADFDRILAGTGAIHGKIADSEWQDRAETLSQVFFAAVQPIHCEHEWYRLARIFRQAQVADDFFSFEGNLHDFEWRIPKSRVGQESLDCLFVRTLLAGGSWDRPASEGIKPPRADVVGVRFRRIVFLQRLRLIHVAIGHSHKTRRPFVFVASVYRVEGVP